MMKRYRRILLDMIENISIVESGEKLLAVTYVIHLRRVRVLLMILLASIRGRNAKTYGKWQCIGRYPFNHVPSSSDSNNYD